MEKAVRKKNSGASDALLEVGRRARHAGGGQQHEPLHPLRIVLGVDEGAEAADRMPDQHHLLVAHRLAPLLQAVDEEILGLEAGLLRVCQLLVCGTA